MGKILTVAIEKGGNGKTTTAINIAALAASEGKRVLVVDLDAQANTTFTLTGLAKSEWAKKGIYDLLRVFDVDEINPLSYISSTNIQNIDIIPSNEQTSQILKQLDIFKSTYGKPTYYYIPMALSKVSNNYDLVIIDTPPSQDDLAVSGLFAADNVLIPVKPDQYSIHGLLDTFALISKLEQEEQTEINIVGLVLTMVERAALTGAIRSQIQNSEFGDYLFKSEIRKGQAVNDSTAVGVPVVLYAKSSNPSKDYIALYSELKERLGI